jgi:hypothetical protein
MAVVESDSHSGIDTNASRVQMERVLAHALFKQSKRYPAFLRHVVEQTLSGYGEQLKERSIGIDVFGRSADYDLAADPIVRVTAAEVRKRLAQYYYDSSRADELRIELPTGSYVPRFRLEALEEAPAPSSLRYLPEDAFFATDPPAKLHSITPAPKNRWLVYMIALVTLIGGGVCGYFLRSVNRPNLIEQFWAPVLATTGPVVLCVGAPESYLSAMGTDPEGGFSQRVDDDAESHLLAKIPERIPVTAVIALTRVASTLNLELRPYQITFSTQVSFDQVRRGPIVLIGAMDNFWTLHLTQGLRYGFARSDDGKELQIIDRKASGHTSWFIQENQPYRDRSRDYALVARFHDKTTGQFVIVVAGLGAPGTEAASEYFSRPVDFARLLQNAPKNWQSKDFEAVIGTQVIGGHPGPPNVVAIEYW